MKYLQTIQTDQVKKRSISNNTERVPTKVSVWTTNTINNDLQLAIAQGILEK